MVARERVRVRKDAERQSGSITEQKGEKFTKIRVMRLNENAQANHERLLLSNHCHYFVIMVVGTSFHVLLITDKGLRC